MSATTARGWLSVGDRSPHRRRDDYDPGSDAVAVVAQAQPQHVIIGFDGIVRKIASALTLPAALDRDLELDEPDAHLLTEPEERRNRSESGLAS
jgi:hypothetical protein